jgi:sulfur-carrier protein adenylyltransferase/sulfurtransferase
MALRGTVRNVEAGGFVAFEGWVRNHNEGKTVERLEYEAYEAVCLTEGNAIIADAIKRFGLLEARCVHRVGALDLEDMAVWVGVSAAHRGEAFDACRFIIDSVKHRLPIWKKEHYTDGDSGWVNCEHCAHAGLALEESACSHDTSCAHDASTTISESSYYARQVHLKEVGQSGQAKLKGARVLVVGAGGLGSPVLQYLAAAGIGHLGICEGDTLEASNLHRQVLFDAASVGEDKGALAEKRLMALNPFIDIRTIRDRLSRSNVVDLVSGYDVLVDCTDNFETKFLLNDVAVLQGKLLVQASIYQYEGQLFVYDPACKGPCVRCLWPEMPKPGCVGSCAEVGVLGAIAGVFGTLQAMEVLKQILDLPGKLQGETLFMDLLSLSSRKVRAEREEGCPVCGPDASITAIEAEHPVELEAADLNGDLERYALIDIRDAEEAEERALPFKTALQIPANDIRLDELSIKLPEPWLLVCTRGMRSKYLAAALRKAGHEGVYSLRGGVPALDKLR